MSNFRAADRDSARTDAQAKERLLRVLNRSLSTVCTGPIWLVSPVPGSSDEHSAITNPPAIHLKAGNSSLFLRSTLRFTYVDNERFRGERKVSTCHYAHTVGESEFLKPQLYSWEWASSEPRYPHLHIRRSDPAFHGLGKLHIPTGRVFYEDVLRFLIAEHGVEVARADWQDVLDESFRRVSTFASWGGGHHERPRSDDA